jgi:hypothetical protein
VEVTRQHVVEVLRRAGFGQRAEEVAALLPDPVEVERAAAILQPYGITKDELISRMGGSP